MTCGASQVSWVSASAHRPGGSEQALAFGKTGVMSTVDADVTVPVDRMSLLRR